MVSGWFNHLNDAEKRAVAEYVRAEYDCLLRDNPTSYVARNAKEEPEQWQRTLREVIASNPASVRHLVGASVGNTKTDGFMLIELSIVLVIIGLIVGGVLVGQNLVAAAAMRATVAQIEKYNTATNTFRDKYSALPGDVSGNIALSIRAADPTKTSAV